MNTVEMKIEVLRRTRADIESNRYMYICNSLLALQIRMPGYFDSIYEIKKFIDDSLGDSGPLDTWIADNSEMYIRDDMMVLCRLAWIDKMIDCLQKDGILRSGD